MGTRSTTKVLNLEGDNILSMYGQYDGYESGHGSALLEFIKSKPMVNGYSGDKQAFNGMGCLAAQLVSRFKGNETGGFYMVGAEQSEEYDYTVYAKGDYDNCKLFIKVEAYGETVFDGEIESYNPQ
ncbi:hypothetical protein [Pseudoalteromonas virus vB_PspP-H6/1]|nr:hypothetical protein [Pseudoalteromonas virus vB_PspP-H6/1]